MPVFDCCVCAAVRMLWIALSVFAAPAIAPNSPPEPAEPLALACCWAKPSTVGIVVAAPPAPAEAALPRMLSGVIDEAAIAPSCGRSINRRLSPSMPDGAGRLGQDQRVE